MDDYKLTILPEDLFLQFCEETKFVKVIKSDKTESYQKPLIEGFNEIELGMECGAYSVTGGIRFNYQSKICDEIEDIHDAKYYAEVTIPRGALIFNDKNYFKANSLIIGEIQEIKDMSIWKNREHSLKMVKKKSRYLDYITCLLEEDYIELVKTGDIGIRNKIIGTIDNLPTSVITECIKKSEYVINNLNKKYKTVENYLTFVKEWNTLTNVPDEFRIYEMYLLVIAKHSFYIKTMPKEFLTRDIFIRVLSDNKNSKYLDDVPTEMFTEEFISDVIQINPNIILDIRGEYLTDKLWARAIQKNGILIEHIIYDKNICTEELIEMAVENNGLALQFINPKTEILCKKAFANTPYAIQYIPDPTNEMCEEALKRDKAIFPIILKIKPGIDKMSDAGLLIYLEKYPEKINTIKQPTEEMILIALKHGSWNIFEKMDPRLQTQKVCEEAFNKRSFNFQHIKEEFQTTELCEKAMKASGLNLQYVKNKTLELCLIAIQKFSTAIKYVPEEFLTEEMCISVLSDSPSCLSDIKKPTYNMCKLAVQVAGYQLSNVPKHLITVELCEIAVKNSGHAIKYVPSNLYSVKLFEMVYKDCPYIMNNLKYHGIKIPVQILCQLVKNHPDIAFTINWPSLEICLTLATYHPEKTERLSCNDPEIWVHMCLINPIIFDNIKTGHIKNECEMYLKSIGIL